MDDCRSQSPLPALEYDAAPADDQLLMRYVASRDEQAFRGLVARHAALVLGVCRRVLVNHHDAEEAFQATFLVLAQKAGQLRIERTLAPWLYGVAHRIAIRAAQKRSRRREEPHVGEIMVGRSALEEVTEHYDRQVLDQELSGLPERLREPLVLHYLLGWTNRQIAEQLQLTVRTVEGRQRRGKTLLRRRMALRKVSLPSALTALAVSNQAVQAAALAPLVEATAAASLGLTAGHTAANLSTSVSENTLQLGQTEAMAMSGFFTPSAMIVGATVAIGSVLAVLELPAAAPGRGGQMAMLMLQSVAAEATASDTAAAASGRFRVAAKEPRLDDPFYDSQADRDASSGKQRAIEDPFGDPNSVASDRDDSNPSASDDAAATKSASDGLIAESSDSAQQAGAKESTGDEPGIVDLSDISPNERRIRAALASQLRSPLDFVQLPLAEVVDHLSHEYGFQILFDTAALDEALISPDSEVTIALRDMPLKPALELILTQLEDLTFVVEHEVLLITTADKAVSMLETHIYDVSRLGVAAEEIVERMPNVVEPQTWQANSETRNGNIVAFGEGAIAVMQTQRVHEQVVDFLEQLHRLSQRRNGDGYGEAKGGGMF